MSIYIPLVKDHGRRVKRIVIQGDILLDILRGQDGTRLLRTTDIPEDAKTVGLILDDRFNTVTMYVESAEFPEVSDSQPPDILRVAHTLYTPDIQEPNKLIFTVGEIVVERLKLNRQRTVGLWQELSKT